MKYIYGPINSRRLGFSLGISLIPYKTCNFDCVYCQLGKTPYALTERKEYVKIDEIISELKSWLANNISNLRQLDYITFSGVGEPTLNIKIGQIISEIRKITAIPIAVITNSSFLSDPSVFKALLDADLIVPSLDAATQSIFEKVDRPAKGIKIEDIIDGLIRLRKAFSGKIWLEVMLIKGVNDDLSQMRKLKEAIEKINPDRIQLNSPVRATAEPDILPVERNNLEKIRKIFGDKCEII